MIELYFDYVSPYAYLGATRIRAIGARYGREIRPIAARLAALAA